MTTLSAYFQIKSIAIAEKVRIFLWHRYFLQGESKENATNELLAYFTITFTVIAPKKEKM